MAVWEVEAIIGHGIGADGSVTGTYNMSVCVCVCVCVCVVVCVCVCVVFVWVCDHPFPPATPSIHLQ